ncbi:MAG: hypothetical protein QW567_04675 [Candidatus Hadarchaeales archaeon]
MSMPPELAWLVPILVPFIIGFLVGALVKKSFKVVLLFVILIAVLVFTGILNLSFSDLWERAMEYLPKIAGQAGGWLNLIPYTSLTFIIGFVLALWKVKS